MEDLTTLEPAVLRKRYVEALGVIDEAKRKRLTDPQAAAKAQSALATKQAIGTELRRRGEAIFEHANKPRTRAGAQGIGIGGKAVQ